MNITTWTGFAKRKNSTLQPATSDGTTVTARLKENTSTANPVFILQGGVSAVNYVRAFSRYYFVDDVVSIDNNMHELHCSIDVLATYRSTIRSYTAFVERAASSYDVMVRDSALSSRQSYIAESSTLTDISSFLNRTGCFVAAVMSKRWGTLYYLTNTIDVYKLILDSGCYSAQDISEWINSKIAAAFDLDVYIGSILWMPLDISSIGIAPTVTDKFTVGPVAFSDGLLPSGFIFKIVTPTGRIGDTFTITTPGAYYGDFRDGDPEFSIYTLTLPGIGSVQLDSSFVGHCLNNNIGIEDFMTIDLSGGSIVHHIGTTAGYRLCEFKGSIAVEFPLGKSKANVWETIAAFIGGTSNAASSLAGGGGSAGSIISGVGQSLLTGVSVMKAAYNPQTSIIGGSGNYADIYAGCPYIEFNRRIFGSKEFPLTVAGRPLYQNVQLSTLSGFVKCGNASVPISGYDQDKEAVNGYLNSGFYME